jgi:hypothetical protein
MQGEAMLNGIREMAMAVAQSSAAQSQGLAALGNSIGEGLKAMAQVQAAPTEIQIGPEGKKRAVKVIN